MKRTIAICVVLLATVVTAAAESPVAIVEDVQGKVTGAEFMDYLTPKMVIKLGANSSIVISYLKSCRREKIDGIGTVIIGTDESLVHLASVKDEKTECDASHAHATTQETSEVAATVVRSIAKNDIAIKPQLTLYWGVSARTSHGTRHPTRRTARCPRRTPADRSRRQADQGKIL